MNQEGPLSSSRFFIAVFCCLCHYAFHLCFLSCFSVSKMCPTLWPYALRHARLPCHSLSSRICPSSCQWCHPTISPFPSPEDLPNPGIETASPVSPALLASSLHTAIGEARLILCRPLFLLPSIFPRIRIFPVRQLFTSRGWSIGASGLALVCPMNIQGSFTLDWLIRSPYCPRDSQESSPAPQFESINFLVLSPPWCISHIHTWLLEKW